MNYSKLIFSTLLLVCFIQTKAQQQADEFKTKMIEVNKEWLNQEDVNISLSSEEMGLTDDYALIKTHLMLVEQTLRKRAVEHLNPLQQANREELLNALHAYWQSEAFPINTQLSYRNPVFIDESNNYCAVGHLIKSSGNDHIAKRIAASTNFAFVKAINEPALLSWAEEAGFTVDELAWIQPSYPPQTQLQSMGDGTNGSVYDVVSTADGQIIVAGKFTKAGGGEVSNIAAWVSGFAGFTWTDFNEGVNGTVKSLLLHENDLYVGGQFTKAGNVNVNNITKWDGESWIALGNINGTVNDIVMYNNELYIGGNFSTTGAHPFKNIAKWDGTKWIGVGSATTSTVNGTIETLFVYDNQLMVGGTFTNAGGTTAKNIASFNGNAFTALGDGVPATVRAIASYKQQLYAAGDFISGTDTFGIARFANSKWENLTSGLGYNSNLNGRYIASLSIDHDYLFLGGRFEIDPFTGTYGRNLANFDGNFFSGIADLDSSVHALATIHQSIYVGGDFEEASTGWGGPQVSLRSITNFAAAPATGIEGSTEATATMYLYPNPATTQVTLSFDKSGTDELINITLFDLTGKTVAQQQGKLSNTITFSTIGLKRGSYLIRVEGNKGYLETQQLLIQ
jgi:hypothetical protein